MRECEEMSEFIQYMEKVLAMYESIGYTPKVELLKALINKARGQEERNK